MRKLIIMLSLLVLTLSACSVIEGSNKESMTIATANYTEKKILAYMYQALIEDATDMKVDVKTDLGMDPKVIKAMEADDVQMSTQYTGTALSSFFSIEHPNDAQATLEQAKNAFADEFNFKCLDPIGFENKYAFTVRKEVAEEYNLEKISDVEKIADNMTAGFSTVWKERKNDGYEAFKDTYGFEFGKLNPMEIGLVYDAVNNKEIDIAVAYSTDPRIEAFNLTTLEDDKNLFPPYDVSPVIKQETLDKHPNIKEAIKPLIGAIDEKTMRQLNGKADLDDQEPKEVAVDYLKKQGLLD